MKAIIPANKAFRRLVETFTGAAGTLVAIWLIIHLFSWAGRHDRRELMKQKKCWNEIYAVIEKEPKEKAEWIRRTVDDRRLLAGGVDYCGALEFIRNGEGP